MIGALRVVWRGIVQFERYGWLYILANMLSIALSLPIITIPAAYAGLCRLSHTAQTGQTTTIREFWAGFRAALGRGIIVGILNIVVVGILIVNFLTYQAQSGLLFIGLRTIWVIILIGWFGVQLYLWPMLDEMEPRTLIGGFRNATLMVSLNPVFSLTLLTFVLLIVVISTALAVPWLLLTSSLLACISNAAVLDRLALARKPTT
ncbi:MAG: DUF624 domain-containing protein [Aggregatilineales bacterium]